MKHLMVLAARSAWNRRLTLGMTLIAIALSVTMLLGVERVRHEAREGFAHSVSGTDLIVGARTSPIQLMLYAVFRIGEATNNIRWKSSRSARPPIPRWHGQSRSPWAIRIAAFRCWERRPPTSSIFATARTVPCSSIPARRSTACSMQSSAPRWRRNLATTSATTSC